MKSKSKQSFVFMERTRGVRKPNYLSSFPEKKTLSKLDRKSSRIKFLRTFQGLLVTDVIVKRSESGGTSGALVHMKRIIV